MTGKTWYQVQSPEGYLCLELAYTPQDACRRAAVRPGYQPAEACRAAAYRTQSARRALRAGLAGERNVSLADST